MKYCLALLLILPAAACAFQDPDCGCTEIVPPQTVTLQQSTGGKFRFRDILGQDFAASFVTGHSYASANASISILDTGSGFLLLTVSATGLKPNFAYQIKFAGRPSTAATNDAEFAASDDATNERIGRLGRWWRAAPNPANASDGDYDAHKTEAGYIYQGYLIVGYFVTDANGNANTTIEGSNSFHVLWRTNQRLPSLKDGPTSSHTLADTTGNPAYAVNLPPRDAMLYGEWEPTRADPGDLKMPQALYNCDLVLNEESFHESGELAGEWPIAMKAPVRFSIQRLDQPNSTPAPSPLVFTSLKAAMNLKQTGKDGATVVAEFNVPEGFALDGVVAEANLLGVTRAFTLNKKGMARSTDGTLSIKDARKSSLFNVVKVTMRKAKFAALNTGGAATLNLKLGPHVYAGTVTPDVKSTEQRGVLTYKK